MTEELQEDTLSPEELDDALEEELPEEEEVIPIEAPQAWSDEYKQLFPELPRNVQEYVSSREKEAQDAISQKGQELSKTKQAYQTLDEILQPYRPSFGMSGLDDAGALRYLLNTYDYIQKNPTEALQKLAQNYGVDFSQRQEEDETDPHIKALNEKIGTLQNQLNQVAQSSESSSRDVAQQQITEFSSRKNEAGQPMYPHFETVKKEMGVLMSAGLADSMEDAYQKAIWQKEDTRTLLLDSQKKSESEAQKQVVAKAKKAGRKVSGDNPAGKVSAQSLEEAVRKAYRKSVSA